MAEVTYYFDEHSTVPAYNQWADPDYMVDNVLTNHAYTSTTGYLEVLTRNTCPGTDLGTITKVELRDYGYGDGDDKIALGVFGHTLHDTVPGTSPGWTAYVDITSDVAKVWGTIPGMNISVQYVKSGKANVMHCGKVEIRIIYTPSGPPGYPYHRYTLKGASHSGRRGYDEATGHRRGFWPSS